MTIPVINLQDVGQAIQLALTPVFLVTGIAALLGVMTGRLARIIDRWRQLTEPPDRASLREQLALEFASLQRRRYLASSAITACTLAALLVCTDVEQWQAGQQFFDRYRKVTYPHTGCVEYRISYGGVGAAVAQLADALGAEHFGLRIEAFEQHGIDIRDVGMHRDQVPVCSAIIARLRC